MKKGQYIQAIVDGHVPAGTYGVINGVNAPGISQHLGRCYIGVLVNFGDPIPKVISWEDAHNPRKFLVTDKEPTEPLEYSAKSIKIEVRLPVIGGSTDLALKQLSNDLKSIGVTSMSTKESLEHVGVTPRT